MLKDTLETINELLKKVTFEKCGGDEAKLFAYTTVIDLYGSGAWDGSCGLIIEPSPDSDENSGVSSFTFRYSDRKDNT